MSAGSGYVPATVPCPAPMTRAALLALRAGGSLRVDCHYEITDFASGTLVAGGVVELHATAVDELSENASYLTPAAFGVASSWRGQYDIDANGFRYLADDRGNQVYGTTQTAAFPWTNANFTLNTVHEGAVLANQAGVAVPVTGNEFMPGSLTDFNGLAAGSSITNSFIDGQLFLGGTGGAFTWASNRIEDGFRFAYNAGVGTIMTARGCRFIGHRTDNPALFDTSFSCTGPVFTWTDSDFYASPSAPVFALNGAPGGNVAIVRSKLVPGAVALINRASTAAGALTITDSEITEGSITCTPGTLTAAPVSITDSELRNCVLLSHNTVTLAVSHSRLTNTSVTINGASRGISLVDSEVDGGTITPARSGSAGNDVFTRLSMRGGSITLSSNVAPASDQQFTDLTMRGSSVYQFANSTLATALNATTIEGATTVNQSGGVLDRCRFAGGAAIATGANAQVQVVIEIGTNTTLNSANTNTQRSKAFSDVV